MAPDDPLVLGLVDLLQAEDIPCFGPNKDAAIIEGSKAFSKDLMKKYGIPTAEYETFTDMDEALCYLDTCKIPVVVKADGLALGKGVIIAETLEEAKKAVRDMMEDKVFGDSGSVVVIEEFLTGPEVSVLTFTDGRTLIPMVSSMDHKRALDGDKGLNTGGMGTVAPNPYYTAEIAARCGAEILDVYKRQALSDALGITAQGLMTLERVGIRKDTGKILDLVKEYECDTIVIGLPKKLDGSDSIQTEKVYEFRTMLENKMRSTGMKGVDVVWQLSLIHI